VPRHAHEPSYFCALVAGSYAETYGPRQVRYRAGDVAFHPAGETHHGLIGEDGGLCLNVSLDPAWLERAGSPVSALQPCVGRDGSALSWLAGRLHQELERPDETTPLVSEGIALEMLAALLRCERRREAPLPAWLARAENRLREEFARPLSVSSVAAELGVAPVRLARAFRRRFGESLGERLRRIRVAHAARRALDPEVPLARIAQEAGFADQSHMTRVFKRLTGTTPGALRARRERG